MTDDGGDIVGRARYDALGTVLSSTIPLSITGRLPAGGQIDSDAGLVYAGGGRWYDAALGVYLQPDPFGGAPESPESLNRYFPIASGLAGNYALTTDIGRWWTLGDSGKSFVSNSTGKVLSSLAQRSTREVIGARLGKTALHRVSIEVVDASGHNICIPLQRLLRERAGSRSIARRMQNGVLTEWSCFLRLADDSAKPLKQLSKRGVRVTKRNVANTVWTGEWKAFSTQDFVYGFGADLVVGVLWQLAEDALFHPEVFNDSMFARRAGAAGLTNATNGVIGGVGAALVFSALGYSPVGWGFALATIAATVIVDLTIGKTVEKIWFDIWNAHLP